MSCGTGSVLVKATMTADLERRFPGGVRYRSRRLGWLLCSRMTDAATAGRRRWAASEGLDIRFDEGFAEELGFAPVWWRVDCVR